MVRARLPLRPDTNLDSFVVAQTFAQGGMPFSAGHRASRNSAVAVAASLVSLA